MPEKLADARKKLNYADFLVSKSGANEYTLGAFKHIFSACNIIIRILTNFNQIESESPKLVRDALIKFESQEAKSFANFYIELLGLRERTDFKRSDIEDKLRKTNKFLRWAQDRLIK